MIKLTKPGFVKLPGSKSILNRLLLISTMLDQPLRFRNFADCNDISTLSDNLFTLGFEISDRQEFWEIAATHLPPQKVKLHILDSATALRFFLARLCVWEGLAFQLDASPQLKARPIQPLISVLQELGADIAGSTFPFQITSRKLPGGTCSVPANISSQFISSLMLIAPLLENGLTILLEAEIVSRNYILMTQKMMQAFGVKVTFQNSKIEIPGGQKYGQNGIFDVEPDFSTAGYFWAMGALAENWIATDAWSEASWQADYGFWQILQRMGAEVKFQNEMIWLKHGRLHGIDVDMITMPDQVPTLAVLALLADSPTIIRNIGHLHFKESDRIASLLTEFRKISADIRYRANSLVIQPGLQIASDTILDAHHDHRIAMSLYLLKILYPQLTITGMESVQKSYPQFITACTKILT